MKLLRKENNQIIAVLQCAKIAFFIIALSTQQACTSQGQHAQDRNLSSSSDIQNLIDQLPSQGGKVNLPEGNFTIDDPLILKSNVWINGQGRGTVLLVNDSLGVMMKGLKGARVSNLMVRSAERHQATAGIVLDDCGDCQVDHVLTQGFAQYGIWMRNNSFLCEISSCKSADNGRANFYFKNLKGEGRGGDFVPNMINDCISYGGKYGFEFDFAIVLNLTGCAVYQSLDYGYYIHSHSNSINISGSRSFQVGTDAVVVKDSHEVNVSANIFCWHRGHGIVLDNAKWGSVSSNNFIDSGIRTRDGSYKNGVVLKNETKGIQITSNAIFNWGDQAPMEFGVIEDKTCAYNLISNNNINYFTEEGVLSQGVGSIANNNIIQGDSAFVGMDRDQLYPDFDTTRVHEFLSVDY